MSKKTLRDLFTGTPPEQERESLQEVLERLEPLKTPYEVEGTFTAMIPGDSMREHVLYEDNPYWELGQKSPIWLYKMIRSGELTGEDRRKAMEVVKALSSS